MLLKLYEKNNNPQDLQQVVDILNDGGLIIYPTDTMYAIGCHGLKERAIERICRIKNIDPRKNNLSIICYDLSSISEYAKVDNNTFKLMKRNLPGPFTFILNGTNKLPKIFRNRKEVGIRMPDNHIIREITPLSDKDCFYIAERHKTEFTYPIHNHAEFELNFCEKAAGVRRIVGDSAEVIGEYDLVLITGKDLEHVWEQNECNSKEIREITIQFSSDLFFKSFIHKNQFDSIRRMLERAQKGLCFPMSAILKVYSMLDTLASENQGFYAVLKFMTILYELSLFEEEARTLSSSSFAKIDIHSDSRRVQKIQEYINLHYKEEIRLNQLADMVGMTAVSFSRFFKLRTGKNLSDYLIDIRLGFASRLLVDSTMSVAEICYDCGFNNLSNFNRIFKKKKECSPKEFRENYRKKKKVI